MKAEKRAPRNPSRNNVDGIGPAVSGGSRSTTAPGNARNVYEEFVQFRVACGHD